MNTKVNHYLDDGASSLAQATLAYLKFEFGDGIEESWNKEWKDYQADVKALPNP